MTDREHYSPGPAAGARVHKDGEKWTLVLVRDRESHAEDDDAMEERGQKRRRCETVADRRDPFLRVRRDGHRIGSDGVHKGRRQLLRS